MEVLTLSYNQIQKEFFLGLRDTLLDLQICFLREIDDFVGVRPRSTI
jgi:hypothetical protein